MEKEVATDLYGMFEMSVGRWACSPAVTYSDDKLRYVTVTYKQLDHLAAEISLSLKSMNLMDPVFGICKDNSILALSVLLGVLRSSSAFYVVDCGKSPKLDPDLGLIHIFCTNSLLEEKIVKILKATKVWEWSSEFGIIVLFQLHHVPPARHPVSAALGAKIAYVVHTSGTMGQPKLVFVPHECIISNIIHFREEFAVTSTDVIFMSAPLTFDPSMVEIFFTLSSGAQLLIVPENIKCNPTKLVGILMDKQVTVMQATPSLLQYVGRAQLQSSLLSSSSCLRVLALGGERCPSLSVLNSWKAVGNTTRLYNVYGITEVSSWASLYKIPDDMHSVFHLPFSGPDVEIPLGEALMDTWLEVRNDTGQPISHGEGQLYIGGTKRRCVVLPEDEEVHDSRRVVWRASGDWVHVDERKQMYFIGRKDKMVKINGKKVNLQPLAQLLSQVESVHNFAVVYCHMSKTVYAFVTTAAAEGTMRVKDDLLQLAAELEWSNSFPLKIVSVPQIPLTSHGKVNEKVLLEIGHAERQFESLIPDDVGVAAFFRMLWKKFFGMENIDKDSSFILSGGDSVQAVQLSLELEQFAKRRFPLLVDKLITSSFADVLSYINSVIIKGRDISEDSKIHHDKDMVTTDPSPIELESMASSNEQERCAARGIATHCVVDTELVPFCEPLMTRLVRVDKCYQKSSRRGQKNVCTCRACPLYSPKIVPNSQGSCNKPVLELSILWKYDLLKCIDASPLLVRYKTGDGVAFIGSHSGCFAAVNLENGCPFWEVQLPDRIESSAELSSCGKWVVVGCYDYCLHCLWASNGRVHWRYHTKAEVKCSPVCTQSGLVICGSHDHRVYALQVKDGACMWQVEIGTGSIFSSPSLTEDERLVYFASLGGTITSLDSVTGAASWSYCCSKPVFSSPLIITEGVCVCSVSGEVFFWTHHGHLEWTFRCEGNVFSSPRSVFHNGNPCILIGCYAARLYCLSVASGCMLWQWTGSAPYFATPACYCWSGTASVFCIISVTTTGVLDAICVDSGQSVHKATMPGEVFSSPVICGNLLIVGCRDNYLYCWKIGNLHQQTTF